MTAFGGVVLKSCGGGLTQRFAKNPVGIVFVIRRGRFVKYTTEGSTLFKTSLSSLLFIDCTSAESADKTNCKNLTGCLGVVAAGEAVAAAVTSANTHGDSDNKQPVNAIILKIFLIFIYKPLDLFQEFLILVNQHALIVYLDAQYVRHYHAQAEYPPFSMRYKYPLHLLPALS